MLRNHLYRTLLKLGRKFDSNPRFKALIFSSEARFPSQYESDDEDMHIHMEQKTDQAMKYLVDSVCAPGIFYKPSVSLEQIIRKGFRDPLPVELTTVERNQLGFMAARILFNCERLANEISSPAIGSAPGITSHDGSNHLIGIESLGTHAGSSAFGIQHQAGEFIVEVPLLKEADKLEPGVLLVSHPMGVKLPLSNAVVLVTYVSEDHCSGIILNKEFKDDFRAVLDRKERIRYGSYLKEFYGCACFNGGEGEFDRLLNYCILHQQDHLAPYSTKLELGAGALDFLGGSAMSTAEVGAVTGRDESERADAAAVPVNDKSDNTSNSRSSSGRPKDYVYLSHDFSSIAKELVKGTISKQDLKIVRGITDWTDGELEGELAMHKLFMVRPAFSSTSITTTTATTSMDSSSPAGGVASVGEVEEEEDAGRAGRTLLADIMMSRPVPADYTAVNLSGSGGWVDPRLWLGGHYSWCKALYYMGGEYQDLARIHRLTSSDHASTYVSILRHLTDYGTREYLARDSDQSDDGGDGYEDDYDFTTALALLDEDGNATGEVIVGSAGSFGDAEDEDGHDFSDDDDDDDDDKHL